jgi:hypothetical protein
MEKVDTIGYFKWNGTIQKIWEFVCVCEVGVYRGEGSYGNGHKSVVKLLTKNFDTCGDGTENHY